ncbi:MAG TPA: hypothetical protein VEF04_14060 [Blastocatellia bacterium]|nr:hypothetical protein [Blastocatellia bacterium]
MKIRQWFCDEPNEECDETLSAYDEEEVKFSHIKTTVHHLSECCNHNLVAMNKDRADYSIV